MLKIKILSTIIVIVAVSFLLPSYSWSDTNIVKIGILAKRGSEKCLEKWTPTAQYLSENIPDYTFEIIPLEFEKILSSVENKEIDFIFANPSFYVELEHQYNVSRIVTLRNLLIDKVYIFFAGVIFHRKDRKDINNLEDLKNKTFMAVKESSFGGWRMALREFKEIGIDPYNDFKSVEFAGTHDSVVYAVQNGVIDAGTVRTEILERMAADGKINLDDFQILHQHGGALTNLPFLHSTRVYPEWPIAKLKHVPAEFAKSVAATLMNMPPNSPAAKAAKCAGWTVPLNYQPVHECLKVLRLGPYKEYGRITIYDVFKQYSIWILFITLLILSITIAFIKVKALNVRLNISESEIKSAHSKLEERVKRRTADLARTNLSLRNEILARRQAVKALEDSEHKARTIINSVQTGILLIDSKNHKISDCNPVAANIIGEKIENIIGSTCHEFICPNESGKCPITDLNEEINNSEKVIIRNDGSEIPILKTAIPVELDGQTLLLESFIDLSTQRHLEEQLRQSQKLEGIGQLAGGIAHDFNNMLTAINGYAELSLNFLNSENSYRVHSNLKQILKSGKRAENLVRQLLAFSRKQITETKIIDVSQTILNLHKMLRHMIGEDIKIEIDTAENLLPVKADLSQLELIIINLVVNARDAINEKTERASEKKIQIAVNQVCLDSEFSKNHIDVKTGKYILISVKDNGMGIKKDIMEKIFDPFFTTKEVNKGTGLGLATVYGIVKQNYGYIDVQTFEGNGTTFNIYWPCFEGEIPIENNSSTGEVKGGNENILLVEDDSNVREISSEKLKSVGYKVNEAANGLQALKIIKSNNQKFDLLVTDLIMPFMNGKELANKIIDIHPDIKVLFCSGYTDRQISVNGTLDKGINFLPKPYSGNDLLIKIRQVLDSQA